MSGPPDRSRGERGQGTPFVWQRRVGFGDCDPAQIAYTGRIPDFALEAIDRQRQRIHLDCQCRVRETVVLPEEAVMRMDCRPAP